MKKDVSITIKGTQTVGGEKDTTELFTDGKFYSRNDCYYASYKESVITGFDGAITTLKVDSNSKLIMTRYDKFQSQLVIEKGKQNIGNYFTEGGKLVLGVMGKDVSCNINDSGGEIYLNYSLEANGNLISDNEVYINIKERK